MEENKNTQPQEELEQEQEQEQEIKQEKQPQEEQKQEEQNQEKPEKLVIDMEMLTSGTLSQSMDEILEKINNTIAKHAMEDIHGKIKGTLKPEDKKNTLLDYKIAFEKQIDPEDVEIFNEFLSNATKDELGNLTNLVKALGYDVESNKGSGEVGERGFIVLLNYIYSIALSYYCEEIVNIFIRKGSKKDEEIILPLIREWGNINLKLTEDNLKDSPYYKVEMYTLAQLKEVADKLNYIWNLLAKEREEIKKEDSAFKAKTKTVEGKIVTNVEDIIKDMSELYEKISGSCLAMVCKEGHFDDVEIFIPDIIFFKPEQVWNENDKQAFEALQRQNSIVQEIYNSWMISVQKILKTHDFITKPLDETEIVDIVGVDYIPGFHYKNLQKDETGQTYWKRQGEQEFKEILLNNMIHWLELEQSKEKPSGYFSESIANLRRLLFTAFFIRNINTHTIFIDMIIPEIEEDTVETYRKTIEQRIQSRAVGRLSKFTQTGKELEEGTVNIGGLSYNGTKKSIDLAFIYDYHKFKTETLFTYKIFRDDPELKPTLEKMVLGLKNNGEYLTFNASNAHEEAKVISIIAGSRSGKGTLTMGLLASILGTGSTLMYADSKPDIANMLWTLEKQIREDKGMDVKFVAIDAKDDATQFGGDNIVKSNPRYCKGGVVDDTVPKYYLDINNGISNVNIKKLRTLKLIQLLFATAKNNEYSKAYKEVHKYVVIDEICNQLQDLGALDMMMGTKKTEYSNKNTEYNLEAIQDRYKQFNADVQSAVNVGFQMAFTLNQIHFILIGQELKKSNWAYEYTVGQTTHQSVPAALRTLISTTSAALSGNKQVNVEKESRKMYDLTNQEYSMMQVGVFVLSKGMPYSTIGDSDKVAGIYNAGSTSSKDNRTKGQLFRSFFCLIDNDFEADAYKNEFYGKSFDGDKIISRFATDGSKYTTNTLKNVYNSGGDKALKELIETDLTTLSENGEAQLKDNITFYGLVKYLQERLGESDEEFYKKLNVGYEYLNNYFMQIRDKIVRPGLPPYETLDEYLADTNIDSLFYTRELEEMYEGKLSTELDNREFLSVPVGEDITEDVNEEKHDIEDGGWNQNSVNSATQQAYRNAMGDTEEIIDIDDDDIIDDTPEEEPTTQQHTQTNPNNEYAKYAQEQQAQRQQEQQENFTNKGYANYNSQPTDTFDEVIELNSNPFEKVANGGKFLGAVKELSKVFEEEIHRIYGGMDMVETFEVTSDRKIIMNDILFAPRFEEEVIETIPLSIRNKVISGAIADIFSFQLVRKMPGLLRLSVEDEIFANRRVRDELGIPYRKQFAWLFRRMDSLVEIIIGGKVYTRDNPRGVKEERHRNISESLGEKLDFSRIPNPLDNGVLEKVWNSGPAKSVKSGLAWAGGAKLVMTVAPMFGVWGVVFAGAAAVTAVKHIKNKRRK